MSRQRLGGCVSVENELVIDQRIVPVNDASHFAKAAPGVERAGARLRIVGIESDGVAGPEADALQRVLETEAPDTLALHVRMHGHVREIDRPLAVGEVALVDRPGLLRRESEGAEDLVGAASDPNLGASEG